MNNPLRLAGWHPRSSLALLTLLCSGCTLFIGDPPVVVTETPVARTAPDPAAPRLAPLPTVHFDGIDPAAQTIGQVQATFSRYENTFVQIARRYDVGYEALRNANPGVDQWLPGEGTPIYLPTMSVLPEGPRDGILLNLPAMRLFYFTPSDTKAGALAVTSHPIGIGREGWATPTGDATVTQKAREPTWYPPASVRAEHAALGDPLPSIVPPGPDNPLGDFAMRLSMPGYLIHGTNKPAGVGMRVSHGCIRLYPEDIEALFDRVPLTPSVRIVNEPVLAGWRDGQLYLEVHPPLAEDERDPMQLARDAIEVALAGRNLRPSPAVGMAPDAGALAAADVAETALAEDPDAPSDIAHIDWERVAGIVDARRGLPFPVLGSAGSPTDYLAAVRVIENIVPLPTEQSTASR